MALSLLKVLAPKAPRQARKPSTIRSYSSYGGHDAHHVKEVGPISKRVVNARVVFSAPISASVIPDPYKGQLKPQTPRPADKRGAPESRGKYSDNF